MARAPRLPTPQKKIAQEVKDGTLNPKAIDEQTVAEHLYLPDVPDPELLIRTSGELRLSNFLLWQLSYSEFYITDTYWPDFREEQFYEALEAFNHRDRRYGGIKKNNGIPNGQETYFYRLEHRRSSYSALLSGSVPLADRPDRVIAFCRLRHIEFYGLLNAGGIQASRKWGTASGLVFVAATWFNVLGSHLHMKDSAFPTMHSGAFSCS